MTMTKVTVTFETTEEVKDQVVTILEETARGYYMFAEDTSDIDVQRLYERLSRKLVHVVNQIKGGK